MLTLLRRLPRDVRFCLGAFMAARVLVALLAALGWQLPHDVPEPATGWTPRPPAHAWQAAFTGLEHYDASWYLQIASHGYASHDPSAAFFPLYPMLVRAVGILVGGHWLLAAYLVSNTALVLSLVLLYRLTTHELGEPVARWTVVLMLASPVGFFLSAPYTEPVFLLLCMACLTWLRKGNWLPAALAAALASAARSTGIVLGVAMCAQAISDARSHPLKESWRKLVGHLALSAIAAAGTAAYLLYWICRHDASAPFRAQRDSFQREPSWPWTSLWHGLRIASETWRYPGWLITNIEVVITLIAIGLGALAVRRFPARYGALTLASLVLPLTLVRPFSPLTSVPRYYLVVFPLFWALEGITRRPWVRALTLTVSCLLLVLLTLLFAAWHDVL